MDEKNDGIGIGFLKFIRGIGFCMFFMSLGLMFRGEDIGFVVVAGGFGLGLGILMNLAIGKIRESATPEARRDTHES